jgi:AraC-like DNA-binding protein
LLLNPDYDNLTLQAVAEMSGFGNRATFINAFKKYTGVTPSYFLTHKNEILL